MLVSLFIGLSLLLTLGSHGEREAAMNMAFTKVQPMGARQFRPMPVMPSAQMQPVRAWQPQQFMKAKEPMQPLGFSHAHSMQRVRAAPIGLPNDPRIGTEASDDDVAKAYSDLSGMREGDIAVVQRTDGKWTFAQALFRGGLDFGKDNMGTSLNFKVDSDGATKKFIRSIKGDSVQGDWDKIKQLNAPEPGKGIMTDRPDFDPASPLMAVLGKEASAEEISSAAPVSADLKVGDFVALKLGDTWKYARLFGLSGANRYGSFGDSGDVGAGKGLTFLVDPDGNKVKLNKNDWDDIKVLKEAPK